MVADPSQSQGLLVSSTAPGLRQDESQHAVPNNVWDAPQVHDPASEGPQSVDYDGRNGPSSSLLYWSLQYQSVLAQAWAFPTKRAVVTRVASKMQKVLQPETLAASTTTSAPVTSGTTGIAGSKCEDYQLTISIDGNAYFQDCGVYYRVDKSTLSPDSKSRLRNLPIGANGKSVDPITKYSFKDCINECDKHNSNRNATDQACYAVSYYANLDWAFKRWAGDCFLKNGRGYGTSIGNGTEDWEHTASAYKNCLNKENGCG